MYEVLLIADLIVAVMLIALVLIQQGKGADMGASFGAGGSNTVFGASGSGNFLTRSTAVLATLFFVINLALGSMSGSSDTDQDEWQNLMEDSASAPMVITDVPTQLSAQEAQAQTDVPPGTATEDTTAAGSDVPRGDPDTQQ